jgi:hypothetical protein
VVDPKDQVRWLRLRAVALSASQLSVSKDRIPPGVGRAGFQENDPEVPPKVATMSDHLLVNPKQSTGMARV